MFRINKLHIWTLLLLAGFIACKVSKNKSSSKNNIKQVIAPQVTVKPITNGPYQAAATRSTDIEHMNLAVRFDYQKQHVLGQATLTCKPYFYAIRTAQLDARGFDIHRVALIKQQDTINLAYTYQNDKLTITLDTLYTAKRKFVLFVDYTAKPNEIKGLKGRAITDDKGLYFINPLKTDTTKPRQIWTQGETQSNSCWFPTNDVPNEKITQDLAITVEDNDITLSNGELMRSKMNADGTRTDFWRQTKPHAPYLVMLAVGEFVKVKDYWRDSVEVDYYVEPAFKKHAKMVFGRTPEMMEVFSKKLGVDYPWDKYSQIVVRDFVSGAMENTSAVVHFEGLQHNEREHLDNTHEDVVAHELFHHWFGDLVTCESWSNVPLNESFATYGEYIWQEEAYGRMEADCEFNNNLRAYLGQKQKHKVEPIRYHYQSRDDMFDVVSYQKGGAMLHMLRKIIGDDAFFASLKLYLTQNAYKTAELANLRMAFEEVTGQDLNWFFNQWFLKSGHPDVSFGYIYNATRTEVTITIQQYQQTDWGWYRLPLTADIYTANGIKRVHFTATEEKQSFTFTTDAAIDFVNVDAERALVATITDLKPNSELLLQAMRAPLYMDKYYAVKELTKALNDSLTAPFMPLADYLLTHEFWGIRKLGVEFLGSFDKNYAAYEQRIIKMALHDSSVAVRNACIDVLSDWNSVQHMPTFLQTLNDKAYSVVANSLVAIAQADSSRGLIEAQLQKSTASARVQGVVQSVVAAYSTQNEVPYFQRMLVKYPNMRRGIMRYYSQYLIRSSAAIQLQAIDEVKVLYKQLPDERFKTLMPEWITYQQGVWKDKLAELKEQREVYKKDEAKLAAITAQETEAQQLIDAYASILK
jgi:aminopeptidase N